MIMNDINADEWYKTIKNEWNKSCWEFQDAWIIRIFFQSDHFDYIKICIILISKTIFNNY